MRVAALPARLTRLRLALALVAVFATVAIPLGFGAPASGASASAPAQPLVIRPVDTRKIPTVQIAAVAAPAARNSQPQETNARSLALLWGNAGKYVAALLVLVAAGLAAFALLSLLPTQRSTLETVLHLYDEGARHQSEERDDDQGVTLAKTALVQRAVDFTARLAERRGLLARLEAKLDAADVPLRPAEVLFFDLAGVAVLGLVATILVGPLAGLMVLALGVLASVAVLDFLGARRRKQFTAQLPDTLNLLSGSLRAGYSLLQAVEAVTHEIGKPMGPELNRVLVEARLGRPLEDALSECAQRLGSRDFEWAVMAIRVQREVGGNLAELLSTVAETMVQRERIRREIKALTAEGRMSAIILGLLPIGLGLVMYVMNPEYIKVLFTDSFGQMLAIGGSVLGGFGFWWMKKTIEIEV